MYANFESAESEVYIYWEVVIARGLFLITVDSMLFVLYDLVPWRPATWLFLNTLKRILCQQQN